MSTGADDVWLWWALGGGGFALIGLAISVVFGRRGRQRELRIGNVVAVVGALLAVVALGLLFG